MGVKIKIFAFVIGIIFFIFVFRFIKKSTFPPSFAVLWIGITLFLVSIPVFEGFYQWIAYSIIGISDARNIIYIAILGFLLIYIFYITTKLSRMSDQIQELISSNSILENKIDKIKNENT